MVSILETASLLTVVTVLTVYQQPNEVERTYLKRVETMARLGIVVKVII